MNFLAHALLSGDEPDLLFGNFIADSVKGNQILKYSETVQRGIRMHRFIDEFTDHHPEVKQCVHLLLPQFRKYSPVVVDVYFDHFLSRDWQQYSSSNLNSFVRKVYRSMISRFAELPARSRYILPWMITQNWLGGYGNYSDLDRVFKAMAGRTKFESGMEQAVIFLQNNEKVLHDHFSIFYPQLGKACRKWLLNNPIIGS